MYDPSWIVLLSYVMAGYNYGNIINSFFCCADLLSHGSYFYDHLSTIYVSSVNPLYDKF